jgi:hypothetical protein
MPKHSSIGKSGAVANALPPVPAVRRNAPILAAAAAWNNIPLYALLRGLKALRAWLDFKQARIEPPHVDLFTNQVKDIWLHQINFIDKVPRTPLSLIIQPPLLKTFTEWTIWEQRFRAYIHQHRSLMCATPLSYVLRDNVYPTPEALANQTRDMDQMLVETMSHLNSCYNDDNRTVFTIHKPLIQPGDAWTYAQAYDTRQDGCGAFFQIRVQAEDPVALENRKSHAYSQLNIRYTGFSRKFTFDDYIHTYQRAFNDLAANNEPVAETKKVIDFLNHITDPSFAMMRTCVMVNANLRNSFEQTQQYMKHRVDQEQLMTTTVKRQVAAIGTKLSGTKGKRPKKGRPTKPVRPSDPRTKHLPKAEYDKLTKEQKLALKEARERAKRLGTNATAPTTLTISAVSFSSPTIHNFNPEEAPTQGPLDAEMVFETTTPDKLPATLLNKLKATKVSPQPTYHQPELYKSVCTLMEPLDKFVHEV